MTAGIFQKLTSHRMIWRMIFISPKQGRDMSVNEYHLMFLLFQFHLPNGISYHFPKWSCTILRCLGGFLGFPEALVYLYNISWYTVLNWFFLMEPFLLAGHHQKLVDLDVWICPLYNVSITFKSFLKKIFAFHQHNSNQQSSQYYT